MRQMHLNKGHGVGIKTDSLPTKPHPKSEPISTGLLQMALKIGTLAWYATENRQGVAYSVV